MAIISRKGWPLGTEVFCGVCETMWEIEQGDTDRLIVSDTHIEVDLSCPNCCTRYTASKNLINQKVTGWSISEYQYNRDDTVQAPVQAQDEDTEAVISETEVEAEAEKEAPDNTK